MNRDSAHAGKIPPGRLKSLRHFMRAPLDFFTEVSQCGDGHIVPFAILWMRCHLIIHPESVQHVLTRGAEHYSRITPDTAIFRQAVGSSLLTTEGPPWRYVRRLMHPTFSRQSLNAFGDTIAAAAREMFDQWEQGVAGRFGEQARDHVETMRQLTLTIVARALFSIEDATGELGRSIDALGTLIDKMFHSPTIVLPSLGIPLPPNLHLRAVLRQLDAALYPVIDAHIADAREGMGGYRDLLSLLIAARDEEGHALSRNELRNELLDLLLAGQETTASLLVWALALLAQHPDVEAQLHAELDEVLAGRAPTAEDLSALPLLSSIVQEALRLYPPAWMIARQATSDDEVGGHHIAKGSLVFLSPWVTQRHEGWWRDPARFLPERFAAGQAAPPRGAYFPFGQGNHRCIGEHFALLEAKLVLATLAQRYRLQLKAGHTLSPGVFPALRPVGGLPMNLAPR